MFWLIVVLHSCHVGVIVIRSLHERVIMTGKVKIFLRALIYLTALDNTAVPEK